MRQAALITALALAGTAGYAAALPPLPSVAYINDGLRTLMIADRIRLNCPEIGARMVAGWSFARSLEAKARGQGYSNQEIADFIESKAQRKRLEGEAEAFLKAQGATRGKPATYCALGQKEIAKGSQIGAFLRAK